jgi:hypothetical protein
MTAFVTSCASPTPRIGARPAIHFSRPMASSINPHATIWPFNPQLIGEVEQATYGGCLADEVVFVTTTGEN